MEYNIWKGHDIQFQDEDQLECDTIQETPTGSKERSEKK